MLEPFKYIEGRPAKDLAAELLAWMSGGPLDDVIAPMMGHAITPTFPDEIAETATAKLAAALPWTIGHIRIACTVMEGRRGFIQALPHHLSGHGALVVQEWVRLQAPEDNER